MEFGLPFECTLTPIWTNQTPQTLPQSMYPGGVEVWYLKLEYSQSLTPRKYTKVPFSEYTNYDIKACLLFPVSPTLMTFTNKKTSKSNALQIQSRHQKITAFPIFITIINMYKLCTFWQACYHHICCVIT